jgi:hypothetical protein
MRSVARVRIVTLRKWFPPHDPLAAKIARLCILREDLLIEMQGVYVEDIKDLDESSPQSRRMYFLRNLIRTQMELSGALQTLLNSSEFRDLRDNAPKGIQKAFDEAAAIMREAHPVAKDIRNDICGHVRESAVQAALERIDPDSWGFLDVGRKANRTHYKFAGVLTAEILLKDIAKEERGTISSSKFATIADLLVQTFALIEVCLRLYAQDRGLLPRRG